jgi:hypothetical protein
MLMSQVKLGSRERRLYQGLWLIGFVSWLGAFAMWLLTAETSPWLWLGCGGVVAAVVFGMAVRYDNRVWPFSIWVDREAEQGGADRS